MVCASNHGKRGMKTVSLSEVDNRRIRFISVVSSLALRCLLLLFISIFYFFLPIKSSKLDPLEFQGGGGGGGGDTKEFIIEFGPQPSTERQTLSDVGTTAQFTVFNIVVTQPADIGTPVIKKEEPKKPSSKKPGKAFAENVTVRTRHGVGTGSDGGTGGGSGGGIGKSMGFSIDWGGNGSRRLLSGRYPRYPEGTEKEMIVTLQFTVLPDGSVANIVPVRRSDELLEREAMAALQTWRFDPLPTQYAQKNQIGIVPFHFKLE